MPRRDINEALHLAELLAEFANLRPEDAGAFRNDHPDFAPQMWWETQTLSGGSEVSRAEWTRGQAVLRNAWQDGFSPDSCIALIGSLSNIAWWQDKVQGPARLLLNMSREEAEKYAASHPAEQHRAFDSQRAVMFLHVQAWRAARCEREQCRKYFIKDAKGRRFCSTSCFNTNRLADKLRWWRDTGLPRRTERIKRAKRTKRSRAKS